MLIFSPRIETGLALGNAAIFLINSAPSNSSIYHWSALCAKLAILLEPEVHPTAIGNWKEQHIQPIGCQKFMWGMVQNIFWLVRAWKHRFSQRARKTNYRPERGNRRTASRNSRSLPRMSIEILSTLRWLLKNFKGQIDIQGRVNKDFSPRNTVPFTITLAG